MPWTMDDYPQSWKNFDELERKKAIDIGNAMLKDGYKEGDVIPIATQQAEKWYKDASKEELDELKNKHITQHQKDQSANPKLMTKIYMFITKTMNGKLKLKMLNKLQIHSIKSKTP